MKIKITRFRGFNPDAFANIKNGTIHNVIRTNCNGWIIKGANGDDVLILEDEAEEIKDGTEN